MSTRKTWVKRTAAFLTAGAVAASACVPAGAADSYLSHEREALKEATERLEAEWGADTEQFRQEGFGGSVELSLHLQDAARTILGFFVPLDISWADSAAIRMGMGAKGGNINLEMGLFLNDTRIATLELPIRIEDEIAYLRIPELSEYYFSSPLTFEGGTEKAREESKELLQKIYDAEYVTDLLPDAGTAGELLERYADILLSHITDGTTAEETVQVSGVEEAFTVHEGRIGADALMQAMQQVTKTARDDAQIKEVIEQFAQILPENMDLYEMFQNSMDEYADNWENMGDPGEGNYISSKVWEDADGHTDGRELAFYAEGEKEASYSWMSTRQDDRTGLLCSMKQEEMSLRLSGSGVITDGLLDGMYTLQINGTDMYQIEVEDYCNDPESGALEGTYTVKFVVPREEASEIAAFANYALKIHISNDKKAQKAALEAGLLIAGTELGSLRLEGIPRTEGVPEPAEKPENALNPNDQKDLQTYLANITPEVLTDNLHTAGVPDEVLEQLASLIIGAVVNKGNNQSTGIAANQGNGLDTGIAANQKNGQGMGFAASQENGQNTGFAASQENDQDTGFAASQENGQDTGFAANQENSGNAE